LTTAAENYQPKANHFTLRQFVQCSMQKWSKDLQKLLIFNSKRHQLFQYILPSKNLCSC